MSNSEKISSDRLEQVAIPSAPSLFSVPGIADPGFFDMKDDGWIKSWRKVRNNWIWNNAEYFKAWHCILYEVNHDFKVRKVPIDGEIVACGRGQSINSLSTWAELFGKTWTLRNVRTFLNLLASDGMIVREGLRKTTRITVCNYDLYQLDRQADDKQMTKRRHSDDIQTTTNKNVNNDKERQEGQEADDSPFDLDLLNKNYIPNSTPKVKAPVDTPKFIPPTLKEVKKFFKDNGYTEGSGERAFMYYDAGGWCDKFKNPITNWKQSMVAQWFKPENKYYDGGLIA